jgi:hypothetical protein
MVIIIGKRLVHFGKIADIYFSLDPKLNRNSPQNCYNEHAHPPGGNHIFKTTSDLPPLFRMEKRRIKKQCTRESASSGFAK